MFLAKLSALSKALRESYAEQRHHQKISYFFLYSLVNLNITLIDKLFST